MEKNIINRINRIQQAEKFVTLIEATIDDRIRARYRGHEVVGYRHATAYIIVKMFGLPLTKAGAALHRHHATIQNSIYKIEDIIYNPTYNSELYKDYKVIEALYNDFIGGQ